VENAGRLVTVAELVRVVWADSHGRAPLVKRCIREVRKVLGDRVVEPRYLETVGRRGYRFVAAVHDGDATGTSWASGHDMPAFVGRASELARLGACLESARAGMRRLVLVSGEPGIGKTTLVAQFLRDAATRDELRAVHGQCVEHYGPASRILPCCRGSTLYGERQFRGERPISGLLSTCRSVKPPIISFD
jgi:hypothetical protein